jgi:lysozyme
LRHDEGDVPFAYDDGDGSPVRAPVGYLTIGIGILVDERRGGGLTPYESAWLLNNRIEGYDSELATDYPWFLKLNEPRRAALLNMRHQLGRTGLAGFQRMLGCLRDERFAEAEQHALDSKWAREDSPDRAKRVARQLASGSWEYGAEQ